MLTLANALLVDPERDRIFPGGLVVDAGRIVEVFEGGGRPGLDCRGRHLAPGIIDIGVKVGEPGERHKESFRTAGSAAAAGGVTTIVTRPDTRPAVDTPEALEFLQRRAVAATAVNVLPMAALTKAREGREMTEIGFLLDAGAVAFTDARQVADSRVFQRCLTYARGLGALVIGHPQDPALSDGACMTAGQFASQLGLPAVQPIAERIGLERDLALAEVTGARYHADQISTAVALPALRRARDAGLAVTAGASIHHLTLNELDVGDYRTFFKLSPPLRSEDDRIATVDAVAEGLIDVIGSFHTPQDEEEKRLPFEEAASGAVGLETLLPAAMQLVHAGHLTLPALWRALSLNPARLLGLPSGRLAAGAPADLVLFDPDTPFVLDRANLRSKSKNTPYDLRRMQGRVLGTWVAGVRDLRCGDGMTLALTALLAYLCGSIPFGILVTRALGLGDLRSIGSGNIGATNVLRTGSKGAAAATVLLDGAKGAIPVLLARYFAGESAAMVAALAAFLGHLFPVWLRFRGGKGVATFLGVTLALAWPAGLAACAHLACHGLPVALLLAGRSGRCRADADLAGALRPCRPRAARHHAGGPRVHPPSRQHPTPRRRHRAAHRQPPLNAAEGNGARGERSRTAT